MIELLILYKLSKKVLTMYGISKDILNSFSVMTTPSFGTIKPALTRLEKAEFVKSQKTFDYLYILCYTVSKCILKWKDDFYGG